MLLSAAMPAGFGTRAGQATRLRLIEVAEQLLAERGIDAVSVAEILDAAGQRNKNAVHYYFGGKEGLITAIAEYRSESLNNRRAELLADLVRRDAAGDVRELARTLVVPLAELLDDPRNHFLGFLARYHLDRSRRHLVDSVDPGLTATYREAGRMLRHACGVPRADFEIRFSLVLDMIFTSLAGRQVQERSANTDQLADRTAMTQNLTDCVVGALTAPPRGGRAN